MSPNLNSLAALAFVSAASTATCALAAKSQSLNREGSQVSSQVSSTTTIESSSSGDVVTQTIPLQTNLGLDASGLLSEGLSGKVETADLLSGIGGNVGGNSVGTGNSKDEENININNKGNLVLGGTGSGNDVHVEGVAENTSPGDEDSPSAGNDNSASLSDDSVLFADRNTNTRNPNSKNPNSKNPTSNTQNERQQVQFPDSVAHHQDDFPHDLINTLNALQADEDGSIQSELAEKYGRNSNADSINSDTGFGISTKKKHHKHKSKKHKHKNSKKNSESNDSAAVVPKDPLRGQAATSSDAYLNIATHIATEADHNKLMQSVEGKIDLQKLPGFELPNYYGGPPKDSESGTEEEDVR